MLLAAGYNALESARPNFQGWRFVRLKFPGNFVDIIGFVVDGHSGLIPVDPGQPIESCRKMEEWIAKGPCIGIKYYGGNPTGVLCSHPNNDAIIRLAAEMKAVIYIHSWLQVGGNPRPLGGKNLPGEATPRDVARRGPTRRSWPKLDADLTHDQRLAIFGGNLRRLAGPIFREKGYKL